MRWTRRALAFGVLCGAGGARAQTAPAARDTARDSLQARARRALPDSAARDSIVAAQLRAVRRRARQSPFERLRVDRLRLTDIGVSGGAAFPDQVRRAPLYAVHADYGEIVPDFRAVFGVSYWTSRYTDDAVGGFEQALGRAAGRRPGERVAVGRVGSSDVALNAETRWRPRFLGGRPGRPGGSLRPWLAVGGGLHFVNVQNPALDGTFVARTLDGVAFGPTGALGLDLAALRTVRLSAEARYDLFNGARYGSVRAGASYVFEPRGAR